MQAAHKRLDAAVGAFHTIDEYQRYVTRLGNFRGTMDVVLNQVIWPAGWSWRPTVIAKILEMDAMDLGLPISRQASTYVDLTDTSALLGALYVLEGSALGARILRQRAEILGFHETFGARHLAVLTHDIGQWKSFLVVLDAAPDFDVERAAGAANAVFAFALECFEDELPVHQ
ncbi:biliverdin-producing heme oxygenase [Rhizobium sp. Root482]|uniref:biliverdin-producing heme oxygenase n=1 Tax=Rhizobium sp. Root482 TaxID=1736543 RepID=UPI0006F53ACB|nr:biliverdin-producing heme oxygenase [Rhizobium sp. Root482]KQY22492.1 hypothetical protein ASD31_22590 [Rhizobium sp. Root482]